MPSPCFTCRYIMNSKGNKRNFKRKVIDIGCLTVYRAAHGLADQRIKSFKNQKYEKMTSPKALVLINIE
jgi:hypothetical protein